MQKRQDLILTTQGKVKVQSEENSFKISVFEKKLDFTDLNGLKLDVQRMEDRLKKSFERVITPTQNRCLELQERMADLAELVKVDYFQRLSKMQRDLVDIIGIPDPDGKVDNRCGGSLQKALQERIDMTLQIWSKKLEVNNSEANKVTNMIRHKIEDVEEKWKAFDELYKVISKQHTDFECSDILHK